MKKIVAFVLIMVFALSFSACGAKPAETPAQAAPAEAAAPAQEAAPKTRLDEIKERGYLEVCMEPAFAPYEFIDPNKQGDEQYVGMDVEIAKYIAGELGVELKIIPLEFGALLAAMADGKYDMAISALAYNPSRDESMSLSDSYYSEGTVVYGYLMREEDKGKFESVEAAKDAVIVTQSGSVQEGIVNEQLSGYKELKLVSSMPDGFLMVSEGKADACVCELGSARLYAEANDGLVVSEFGFTVDPKMNGTVVAMPKGEQALTEFVNECVAALKAEGKTAEWYEQYAEYAKTLGA